MSQEACEIDITPEMIAAGMEVVWSVDLIDPREVELRVMVLEVFKRMAQVGRLSRI